MKKKLLSYCSRTPLATFIFLLTLVINGSAYSDFFSMGRLVSGTPFDYKIINAGCFNLSPSTLNLQSQKSIQELFAIARSFRYVSDGGDNWQSAKETEERHAGDCEDKAIWLFTRLINNGYYNVRLVVGRYRSLDSQLHVWVICSDKEGNTCLLDPSIQKRVWYLIGIDSDFYKPLYAYDGQNRYKYFATH